MLDFNEKLSLAKDAKQYRLVADHLIFFYATFMLMPPSAPRKSRILVLLMIVVGVFAQMLLYEQFPDLEEWTAILKQWVFMPKASKDYAIFNIVALIQFFISAVLLSALLAWRLAAVDDQSFIERIKELTKSQLKLDWKKETERLVGDYKDYSAGVAQTKKYSKLMDYIMVAGVVMTIGIFALDYWERMNPQAK